MNVNIDFDVQRVNKYSKNFDARRVVTAVVQKGFDVRSMIPLSDQNYSQLNITLQAHTLADSFSMTVPKGTAQIDDEIKGSLFGWDYNFAVAELQQRNQIVDYVGRYNSDKLNYTNYRYRVKKRYKPYGAIGNNYTPDAKLPLSVQTLMEYIAGQLGLELKYYAWDWDFPLPLVSQSDSYGFYEISGTYQSIITQLFGWLSSLPNIDFSVTIRDNKLYVVQRGQEPTTYVLNSVVFPPTIHKRKLRTEWTGNADWPQNELDSDGEQVPFTGTIEFGDSRNTYKNGLLIEQTRGLEVTTYEYEMFEDAEGNPQNYMNHKEVIKYDDNTKATGTCSETFYNYTYLADDIFLQREYERVGGDYDHGTKDYTYSTDTETTHTPIGNGWYGHTVLDVNYNEIISTSMSQGNPSNAVSQYMVDKTQNILRSDYQWAVEGLIAMALYFANPPLIPTNYPVYDRGTLQKLVDNTDWLNGKTEETVTLDTVDEHIIDLTQKVVYNGNTYSVESNSVTHTPNGVRQSLVLKRWY